MSLDDLLSWAEYTHLNEEANRAYDRDGHSLALRVERQKRDNKRHRVRVRVPMADGCIGVSSGSSFAYACYCEHCKPRVIAARAAALATARARAGEPRELDHQAIEQVLGGYRMKLHSAENREVVRVALGKGKSVKEVAVMIGQSTRMVERHKVRLRADGRL